MLSHLASATAPTGAERSLALLAEGLQRRGHRVCVVVPGRWPLAAPLRLQGVEIHSAPCKVCWLAYYEPRAWPIAAAKWLRFAWPDLGAANLRHALIELAPDVVHVNCLPHLRGAAVAAEAGYPVVWHLREILPPGPRRRWFARQLSRHATRIVAVSEAVAAWLRDEGLAGSLVVVPNGTDFAGHNLDRRSARRELGIPEDDDECVIGLFGQLLPHKGVVEFIKAARRALVEAPKSRFIVAGGGPHSYRERVARARGADAAAELIHLLPPRPTAETLLAAADVVALSTLTPDPFPRSVLEAMAAGLPVAAFRSGGTPEMVTDEETGLLVNVGDVAGLGVAFARLGNDEGLRRKLGRAARARARERFGLERHVERIERILRQAAER
jgi:glycosyltransferase involved in cell wall biosynthesis